MDSDTTRFVKHKESSDGSLSSEKPSLIGHRYCPTAIEKVSVGCKMACKKIRILTKRRAPKSDYPNGWLSIDLDLRETNLDSSADQSENQEGSKKRVLDPQDQFLQWWNKVFVLSCVIAVALDPLFFYIPVIDATEKCLNYDNKLKITACVLRSCTDIFYILHIIFQFHTGYIPPTSRVLGRGELIEDHRKIAKRYLSSAFIIDILSILPLPQIALLVIIPQLEGPIPLHTKDWVSYVILCQYVPRVIRIHPLWKEVTSTTGMFTETAWAGAAFNLFLYMLASHFVGACWYLISIEREDKCWREACEKDAYDYNILYCGGARPDATFVKNLTNYCSPSKDNDEKLFDFGIFGDALKSHVAESTNFTRKFFYCFWWGLRGLSSLGQNLQTSTFVGEIIFAVFISVFGLVLFALLIGNMQTYLQSTTARVEEMRMKRQDAEKWMSHRLLPDNLKDRIRKYYQYKWQVTGGVEEEDLIRKLPKDLKRDIRRHLFFKLLKRVPLFEKMDERLKDAICDHLRPVLYTRNSLVFHEDDPVDEMLFIMRGKLLSTNKNGVISGELKPGDFCGEELLTWALDPQSSSIHPNSTRTVIALKQVEAFALTASDLKFVASQFGRLHSQQLQHVFKFYSQQWKTWAAYYIQRSWLLYLQRRHDTEKREAARALSRVGVTIHRPKRSIPLSPRKPSEPDFDSDEHH